jgi:hypothetical protein
VVIRGRSGAQRSGVDPVLPEQLPDPRPVAFRQALGVAIENLVDEIFVPARAGGGAILDLASYAGQEANTEDRETQAAQADRWCVSST